MILSKLKQKLSFSGFVILIFVVLIPEMDIRFAAYQHEEGVIRNDVRAYYAYLPAAIIQQDLSMEYIEKDWQTYGKWVWLRTTPLNKKTVITTMGLSVLYSPFFLIGHGVAKSSDRYEASGYSLPYHIALVFSVYFYFIVALLLLRKLLLKYFTELATGLTLLAIGGGTNLIHYLTLEAPMSHGYSFFLFILFVYLLSKWRDSPGYMNTILLGATVGLISLVRPTNTLIVILIPLYGATSLKDLKANMLFFVSKWKFVLIMIFMAFLIWLPQLCYWKYIAGEFFYNSYEDAGSAFFFGNPQLFDILFSYKKGWFIYTPLMLLASIGIVFYIRQKGVLSWAVTAFFLINLYVLASWWSWWFGGGFSNRAFIDSYGLMAFPLAAFIDHFKRKRIQHWVFSGLVLSLTIFGYFQAQQYRYHAIHWFWMNKEAYWETFLKLRPTNKYWSILDQPDVQKARKGIYEAIPIYDKKITRDDLSELIREGFEADTSLIKTMEFKAEEQGVNVSQLVTDSVKAYINQGLATQEYKQLRKQLLTTEMLLYPDWRKEIERKANKKGVSMEEMAELEAERIFERYSPKYLYPIKE